MDGVEDVLDREVEAVKEAVHALEHDITALIEHEEANAAREELVAWLEQKQEHATMLRSEERVEDALAHVEEAYRTAAISEEAYREAKEANRQLLDRS